MDKKMNMPVLRSRILWMSIMAAIAVLFILAVQRKVNARVKKLEVIVKPIKGNRDLISEQDVIQLFSNFIGYNINQANIRQLDTRELEDLLKADKRVKKVELFVDSDDRLNVWIVQKNPVVRIMDTENKSYYIDEEGNQVPVVRKSAIRVPLATGNIELWQDGILTSNKTTKLKNVYLLAKKLYRDDFASALIEQIDVNDQGEMVMIPKIGRQEIVIGDASDLDEKIDNLKIMYKEGLPREGWRKFAVLKLNYKGVIFAQKLNNEID